MTYIWFRENQVRLAREVAAVEQLRTSSQWLIHAQWATDRHLYLDAVIRAHGHDYPVRLDYPAYFPDVPPTIRPTNAQFRWTSHQYGGINGPLCLQWGPDTWLPEVTGAQVLESAYALFHQENPMGQGHAEYANPAPSRHHLEAGQELRFQWGRFYVGQQLVSVLQAQPTGTLGIVRFSASAHDKIWFVLVHEVEVPGELPTLVDDSIPAFIRGENDKNLDLGVFFQTNLAPEALNEISLAYHLRGLLWQNRFDIGMLSKEVQPNALGLTTRPLGVFVLDNTNAIHFFMLLNDKVYKLGAVHTAVNAGVQRMPEYLEGLAEKSIGIVGLGSAGSKIAISLARMGARSFYLVDYDVFLPENVERNELDWGSVGEHKVDAVREQLSRVNAKIEVDVSYLHLTGQESNAAVAHTIEQLSRRDIIIDATANPAVFNVLAAVATAANKPMVWLEVFGGGTGGLIARSRPGRDPEPRRIRQVYKDYCDEHPASQGAQLDNYAAEDAEGRVRTASDADVSIIAANAARLAVDTVLERDPSAYPYSLYLIGLEPWWVFTQAMHTIPIPTEHVRQEAPAAEPAPIDDEKIRTLISELIDSAHADANPATP